jgi:uncharacterized phage protein gp47/JayE
MSGITQYGYVRKTLQEILTSMKQKVKSKLGDDWNISTGSIEDQFVSVFAEELDQAYQGLEGVVSSNTVDGAEGIYLDDVLSRQGVYRKGKTNSSGRGVVFSNYATVQLGYTINTTATATANNNLTYNVTESRVIDNFMSCYKLSASQLSVGVTYSITVYNTNNTQDREFTWTVTTESNKDQMLVAFAQYLNEVVIDKPNQAYYSSVDRTTYIGFNSSTNLPQPFPKGTLYVQATPRVGSIGHILELSTTTSGFNPLEANGLISLSPTYIGYTSVQNGDDFSAGSDVQTDAEYRLSAINIKETSVAGTPDSIISGLLSIEGVVDAEVYENPTSNFIYDTSGNTVCEPYTYNVAVLGGDDNQVAQVILDKSPANTRRFGTYTSTAFDAKGQTVNVNFTRCGYFDIEVEVSYKTKDGSALTETEKSEVISNLARAASELKIGDIVTPSLLQAVVFQSVSFTRLKSVSIKVKDLTDISSNFTPEDLTADYDEKPRILLDKVLFIRV